MRGSSLVAGVSGQSCTRSVTGTPGSTVGGMRTLSMTRQMSSTSSELKAQKRPGYGSSTRRSVASSLHLQTTGCKQPEARSVGGSLRAT